MKAFIVTGASRGLGQALCKQLLRPDHTVVAISRKPNEALSDLAARNGCDLHVFSYDLQGIEGIPRLMERILERILERGPGRPDAVTLLNNAAQVTPLGPIDTFGPEQVVLGMQVNLLAPIALTQAFLQQTESWGIPRVLANISSGSGKFPAAGMSVYCASKAALNMFTACIRKENHPSLTAYTIDPGMIDTEMQAIAREEARLPMAAYFKEAQAAGALKTPEAAAKKILKKILT